jgi:hypothetical protein
MTQQQATAAPDVMVEVSLYGKPLAVDMVKVLYVKSAGGKTAVVFAGTDDSVLVDQSVKEFTERVRSARMVIAAQLTSA